MCLISSHGISSCLLIEIKSFPKKFPQHHLLIIYFLLTHYLHHLFVISNDPPLETNFPGRNFREFGFGVISV